MLPRDAERPKFVFSCFRVTRKSQNSFFHVSAWRGKTKIQFFMLPRGAERPKFVFSCFRVTRKDQNSIFHAKAWRGKAKIHFFMLPRGAERPKFVFSCFRVARKDQNSFFHAKARRRKTKKKRRKPSKADEPFSSLFKSIVSAYYQSCKRSLSGKYILSPFFTFHAL